jgi:hypothetical protein
MSSVVLTRTIGVTGLSHFGKELPPVRFRQVVIDALASLHAEFEALYTDFDRPLIPPERLIRRA